MVKGVSMYIGQESSGLDLAELLRGETGRFVAACPQGGVYEVECEFARSITHFRQGQGQPEDYGLTRPVSSNRNFFVKKISELR